MFIFKFICFFEVSFFSPLDPRRKTLWGAACGPLPVAGDRALPCKAPVRRQQEKDKDAQGQSRAVTGVQGQRDKRLWPRGVRT